MGILVAVLRGYGRRFLLVFIIFALLTVASAIGYLIGVIFGLPDGAKMWAAVASYFVPLAALSWWFGLRNSN